MTSALLVAVVLIWSTVILKVVRGSRREESAPVERMPDKPSLKVQRDSLKLDYRDPFIGDFVRTKQENKIPQARVHRISKEPKQPPPAPDFTFKGLIGNESGQKAMVLNNGSLHLLGVGDTFGEYEVVGIFPEYVLVKSGKFEIEVKVR